MTADNMDQPVDEGNGLKTWFASARRADDSELMQQIEFISNNEIMHGMLATVSGLMAVLNEQRQILAVNDGFFRMLGIDNPAEILGLRPGEALHCSHATDSNAGCGTARFCTSCGAAVAISSALATDSPVERKCALSAVRDKQSVDFCLSVKAVTITLSAQRFLLLFVQDITAQELHNSLEKVFYHDIEQGLKGLGSTVELMTAQGRTDSVYLLDKLRRLSENLVREVHIQNSFINNSIDAVQINPEPLKVHQVIREMNDLFFIHPAAKGKNLKIESGNHEAGFVSDLPLLARIISNMILNAFEATEAGGEVLFRVEEQADKLIFRVWNDAVIPPPTALRVFQHYFTTKEESGRGVGTYSMKIFGEKLLGGNVSFTSTKADGTWFNFSLPIGC